MSEHLEPLPPEVQALLERERPGRAPPSELRERIWSRVQPQLPTPPSPGSSASTKTVRASASRAAAKLLGPVAAVSFGLGGATGALLHARLAKPSAIVVSAPAPTPPAPVAIATPRVAPSAPVAVPRPLPHRHREEVAAPPVQPTPPAPAPAEPETDDQLAAERALLEMARTALTRGESANALKAVEQHAQQFPNGELVEEREALRIQALVSVGRAADARAAAGDFRKRFPDSLLLPAVDAAIRSIP